MESYAAAEGAKKDKASAYKGNNEGSSVDSGGRFAPLADDADEPEKGGQAGS